MQSKKEMQKELEKIRTGKKSQYNRQNDFIKDNYDRLSVCVPKGIKSRIVGAGFSVNGFVNDAIIDYLQKKGI